MSYKYENEAYNEVQAFSIKIYTTYSRVKHVGKLSLLASTQLELRQAPWRAYIQYTTQNKAACLEDKEYRLVDVSPMSKILQVQKQCIVLNQCFVLIPIK